MSNVLRFLGFIYLIAAVVVGIVIIYNYGTVEVGVYYTSTETNWFAIGGGVGVIFQGMLVLCGVAGLAHVMDRSDEIADKINEISYSVKAESSTEEAIPSGTYKQCSNCGTLNEESAKWCKGCNGYLKNSEIVVK